MKYESDALARMLAVKLGGTPEMQADNATISFILFAAHSEANDPSFNFISYLENLAELRKKLSADMWAAEKNGQHQKREEMWLAWRILDAYLLRGELEEKRRRN